MKKKWAWAECDELIFLVFSSHSCRSHVSSSPLRVTPARATVKETIYFSSLETGELLPSGTPLCTITVSTKNLRIYHDSTTSYLQYIDVEIYSNLGVLIFSCLLRNSGQIVINFCSYSITTIYLQILPNVESQTSNGHQGTCQTGAAPVGESNTF